MSILTICGIEDISCCKHFTKLKGVLSHNFWHISVEERETAIITNELISDTIFKRKKKKKVLIYTAISEKLALYHI